MIAGRFRSRSLSAAALTGTLLCVSTACGDAHTAISAKTPGSAGARSAAAWREPASYAYTLTSTTQVLAGTFRIEVRDGAVTKVVGLDEDSRRQAREQRIEVPTIGELLDRLEKAREDNAEEADARFAADGRPVRISLDRDRNTIDDEALYLISAYEPAPAG
ncbi:DUF6174 domain-containing protein [Streptomyces echinatus]|uniref:Lipoprotein n=1 Tax=Streptomyces echinatus TaxID=67293 RepID=A0A7W9UV04_9ACTN|nr:DUF6174 domain-containing protein [Streptomyces echinatus]MBB5932102.1 hypothetical protein [Streptomyces echinatus]